MEGTNKLQEHAVSCILCVHIIFYLLINRDLCENRNVSVKFPCALLVYLHFSSRDLLIFSLRVSPFRSYFCVIRTLVLSFPMWFLIADYKGWGLSHSNYFSPSHLNNDTTK